jgi:hypothetical protein
MIAKTTASLLLAGLMAGAAWAQTASATSDVPVKAGEASTMTHGRPNMATNNEPAASASSPSYSSSVGSASSAPLSSASGAPVGSASSTAVMGAPSASVGREIPNHNATVTTNVPTMAGEASTMTNGVPNVSTNNPHSQVDGSRVITPPVQQVQRVPQQAGEASTMVGGRPNANPEDPIYRR